MRLARLIVVMMFGWLTQSVAAQTPEQSEHSKDLIVVAAPSVLDAEEDPDYAAIFDGIVEFDIAYVNAVYGNDKVLLLVDRETKPLFDGKVPDDALVVTDPLHIWMRDFTTVNPYAPVQFRYTPVTFDNDQAYADNLQRDFNHILKRAGVSFPKAHDDGHHLMLDGGNIVDSYEGRVIATTRFLEDNELSMVEGVQLLKDHLGATEVALIPSDDPYLAHSDGMVMFTDHDTLFLNAYDEPLRSHVMTRLREAFPGVKLIELEADWDESDETSACGINLNATVTDNFIYMPHFGNRLSDDAMAVIAQHTDKTVVPVPANGVCKLGGSVRCLSWQQSGAQGIKVFNALRALDSR